MGTPTASTRPPAAAVSCNSSPQARSSPASGFRRRRAGGRRQASRPDHVGAAQDREPDQDPEGSDQRLRLRAGRARQNVPPAHFGYMASGIDDEVTLRANREGFLKFQLRPRRLVDVSKVDMSDRHPRREIRLADHRSRRSAASSRSTPTARSRSRKAAKAGNHLQILSTADQYRRRGRRPPRAARRSGTSSTPPTSGRSRSTMVKRAENGRLPRGRGDGRPLAAAATRKPCSACSRPIRRDCNACHDRSSLATNLKRRAMYRGRRHLGLTNIQSSDMTWDFLKRLRDTTKMKIVLKGILAHEDAKLAAEAGIDAHHRVEPWRPQRGFRPLDHRRAAGDRRGGARPHAGPDRLRLPPRHRHRQGAVHGRQAPSASAGPISGASAPSARPASSACSN